MSVSQSRRLMALVPLDLQDALVPLASVAAAAAIAAESGAAVEAIVLGNAVGDEDAHAAVAAGADKVWLASQPALAAWGDSEQLIAAFAHALSAPALDAASAPLSLLPAGSIGEEIAARLALRLKGTPLGRCTSIRLTDHGVAITRPVYGGRAQATLLAQGQRCFATMHAARREPSIAARGTASVERLPLIGAVPETGHITRGDIAERVAPVEGAKVVVCGGRGMGNGEAFGALQDLAAALGGALGGSLQAVDAGWVPVARQIGQSGKYVSAELYIGVGVSGTPQHMAGVAAHTRIVAINSDAGADIFHRAEIGVVANWRDVLPPLLEKLQQLEASTR
jgi:electron transfer flavoprotein alpha subunit